MDGPLDLRLNPNAGISAAERLDNISREELSGMLYENSDEPYCEELAKAITDEIRKGNRIDTTTKLRHIIEQTLDFLPEKDKKDIRILFKNMESTFQKVGIVKYDAFQQMGGKLSFSLALLNEKNDGFIINSVHSSDGCYSYTKEIRGGQSEISLGNEEKVALDIAIGEEA